jgi:hypothetical protein
MAIYDLNEVEAGVRGVKTLYQSLGALFLLFILLLSSSTSRVPHERFSFIRA